MVLGKWTREDGYYTIEFFQDDTWKLVRSDQTFTASGKYTIRDTIMYSEALAVSDSKVYPVGTKFEEEMIIQANQLILKGKDPISGENYSEVLRRTEP